MSITHCNGAEREREREIERETDRQQFTVGDIVGVVA